MNRKHILIPLDLVHGSARPLVFAQQMALENPVSVTLLHVVDLNIAPALPSVYAQLCAESDGALRKLAKLFFGTDQATQVVVRVGTPADEIVAEAEAESVDMIVLEGPKARKGPSFFRQGTTRHVLRRASCPTIVLPPPEKDAREFSPPQSEEARAFERFVENAAAA
jgi:nucleotide-binding universal stress UspA family protein